MPLAAGGMARIYIGRSTGIGSFERHVVLKLITPERANDHTAVQMFLDEARLAASLNHQNVAQVFEVGEDAGIHYLAMEYVHGQDLRAVLAKAGSQGTRIPQELALTVVAGAAAGLNHAHERRGPDGVPLGIVHRDVSPSNIMIGYDGAVKLLDFGIAKATARSVETQSGIIKGKFAYMAPEQCRGRDVDRRSDVFSLGIILYEVSTQHRCFRADSDFDTMHRIVTGDVVRPTRLVQGYPQALEAVVMKALAVDPQQRYQSAGLLLEALEAFAVSSRMSLSTMGLGRFMRDMFGEMTEPWLNRNSQPLVQKENTVSSTNSSSSQPAAPQEDASGVVDEEARFPDSGGVAAKTILDLPRGPSSSEPDPQPADWNPSPNPKSYPAMPPQLASPAVEPPPRPSFTGPMPAMQPPPMTPPRPVAATQPPQMTPQGSQPLQPLPPSGQFPQTPGSGSSPSHSSHPGFPAVTTIPSTRHGYASGDTNDISYPRYQPPPEPAMDSLKIKPSRGVLWGAVAVIALGAVLLFWKVHGGGKDDSTTAENGSGGSDLATNVAEPVEMPSTPGSAAPTVKAPEQPPPPAPAPADDMIQVKIDTVPEGAAVLVAGDKIGVTPLDKPLKRGTKSVPLTVHMSGYDDVTTKIDLGGDVSRTFTLKAHDEDAGSAAPAEGSDTSAEHKQPEHRVTHPTHETAHPTHETAHPTHETAHPTRETAHPTHETGARPPHDQHDQSTVPPPPQPEHKQPPAPPEPPKPPKQKCQPQSAYNPFDDSCNGAACPVCK